MNKFFDNQTQAQITTVLSAGAFAKVTFAVVGPDSRYTHGSVTVVVEDSSQNFTGYRTAMTSIAASKTYVAGLVAANNLGSKFNVATVDDGNGVLYTLAEVQAW